MEAVKLYNSLDVPWGVFKSALCEGELSQIEDFEELFMQFNEAIGGKELRKTMKDVVRETLLRTKVNLAYSIANQYELTPINELFEALKQLNYHLRIPAPNMDDFNAYWKQIEPLVKLDVVRVKEMEARKAKQSDGQVVAYTLDYFADMELEIQSALNIKIEDSDATRMYCRAVVKLKKHRDNLTKKAA